MPKLQTIDGKTRHYAYTPEGKKAYERDKGAMKMSGLLPPTPPRPDPKPTPTPTAPKSKPKKRQPTEKDMATKLRKLNDMKDVYTRPKRSDKMAPRPKGSDKMRPRPSTMGY